MLTSRLKNSPRNLHSELRLRIEEWALPKGSVYRLSNNASMMAVLAARALEQMHVREVGNNLGEQVGWIQSVIGSNVPGGDGLAYCMSTVQCVIAFVEDFIKAPSPIIASEHCMTVLNAAYKVPYLVTQQPEVGSIYIAQQGESSLGHCGIVIDTDDKNGRMFTIEGNTGSGDFREGNGLYLRSRDIHRNGLLITRGFVRMYALTL